ncbi:RcnB family protein [Dyella sp. C9]|uniref:RcnB family protein n=1 Tax=Dyella sp. C9 TaxID=2202154 RepID=UPI000DEFCB0D|nr:RcnB family protein [Dyella sp. C9]
MKKSLFALALGAAMVCTAATAAPIQYDDHHDHYDQDHGHGRDEHHDYVVVHDRGAHEGWYHQGGYVPVEYRDRHYAVENWRDYRLPPPPRDHQWVRSDNGEFLLVAVATGVIANIVLSH